MTTFTTSNFTVEVPVTARDVSNYAFVLEGDPQMPPTLSISCQVVPEIPDLDQLLTNQIEEFTSSVDSVTVSQQMVSRRDNWHYAVAVLEWTSGDMLFKDKAITLFVEGEACRQFTIRGSALASDYQQAEEQFDAVTRTLKPS